MISAELQPDVSQDLLDIFPRFSQTAQVIDRELEHSAHLSRKGQTWHVSNKWRVPFGQPNPDMLPRMTQLDWSISQMIYDSNMNPTEVSQMIFFKRFGDFSRREYH